MAKTYPKQALVVGFPSDAWLGYNTVYAPEGASQTFVSSSPLVFASGLLVAGATPTTAIAAFSLQAGHNTTAGTSIPVLPVYNGVKIFANFLGAAAADNTLATADLGGSFDLDLSATLLGASSPGWYIEDGAASVSIKMTSFASDYIFPNISETVAANGDTNARVTGEVLDSVYAWV